MLPVLFLLAALIDSSAARAQYAVRTWLDWRTVETKHFVFHYPSELEAWTMALASHADGIDSAVASIVGYQPTAKTHAVVDNPYTLSNGMALPFIGQPVVNLWAVPPDPRDDNGDIRNWGVTLLSHEFTHIAHLSRPSRNSFQRLVWQLAPADLGPIPINAPRWVDEGYATYAEGKVTGSGRPHGAWRPAFLRRWALEGALPRYEQLDTFGGYNGGNFAYLAGSAFFAWLAERGGDSSVVHLWRRMTAKQVRGFDEAFIGVYGESPRTLYGRFTAELTGNALEVERALRTIFPSDTGAIVQRLSWSTGDPAISRDGRRVAIQLASPGSPSRIVIWSTAAQPDTGRARRDSVLLKSDPEDVPARSIYPPPKRVLASLRAPNGSQYENPRFLTDGRVLLTRWMRGGDGTLAPDLFLWNPGRRSVGRVTTRAAIRDGDPSPDGRSAIAMQCKSGWCDVVLVDLATGADRVLLRGSPEVSYYRPRISPDGKQFAVAMNKDGAWRVVVGELANAASARVISLGNNAYDAAWLGNLDLVATVDVDGIANIARYSLTTGESRVLTRVTGAAVAPEPSVADTSIWFLSLYSRGYDLRKTKVGGTPSQAVAIVNSATVDEDFASQAPVVAQRPYSTNAVSAPRPYSIATRSFRWAPLPEIDADGGSAMLALSSGDLVDRSEVLVRLAAGDRASWQGGALDLTWKGFRPFLHLGLFDASQTLSHSRSPIPTTAGARTSPSDEAVRGLFVSLDGSQVVEAWAARYRLAASMGQVDTGRTASRSMLVGDGGLTWSQLRGTASTSESLSASMTVGRSLDQRFYRAVVSAAASSAGLAPIPFALSATYARTSADAPRFEQLAAGGNPPALLDRLLLTQRLSMPALPAGVLAGTSLFSYRGTVFTQPVNLYWWGGSAAPAGSRFAQWMRVVGVERAQAIAPLPVAGLPPVRIVVGAGAALDAPFRNRLRAYASILLNP